MNTPEEIWEKQQLIKQNLRFRAIKASFSSTRESWLEGTLSRGDRQIGQVIETAWRLGAGFDAWKERFRLDLWEQAFLDNHIDPGKYIYRQREIEEAFPWGPYLLRSE